MLRSWLLLLAASTLATSCFHFPTYNPATIELLKNYVPFRGYTTFEREAVPLSTVSFENGHATFTYISKEADDNRFLRWNSYTAIPLPYNTRLLFEDTAEKPDEMTKEARFELEREKADEEDWVYSALNPLQHGHNEWQRRRIGGGSVVFWLADAKDAKILECAARFDEDVEIDAKTLYAICKGDLPYPDSDSLKRRPKPPRSYPDDGIEVVTTKC